MLSKFSEWLNEQDGDRIEAAILGVVSGQDPVLSPEEKEHLMARNTTEFSSDILDQLRNLGLIRNLQSDPQRYHNVIQGIKSGLSIKDLIDRVRGGAMPNMTGWIQKQ